MTKLEWNSFGEKFFELGVDRGVLYTSSGYGVPWNGLVSVNEAPTGTDLTSYYVDGIKVLDTLNSEEFSATISAYTYPDEFEEYDGFVELGTGLTASSQQRNTFGLCYRTYLGNDTASLDYGYKLHLVYNALATPTARTNSTLTSSITPDVFSWTISTNPVYVPGARRSAHIIIDSSKTESKLLAAIEDVLYGKYDTAPRLPTPEDLVHYFDGDYIFKVVDHMDGTYSVISTDEYASYIDATTFQLSKESVVSIDSNSFTATSS